MRLGIKEIRQKRFKREDPPPLWEVDSPPYLAEPLLLGGGAKAALNVPPPIYTRGFGLFETRFDLSLSRRGPTSLLPPLQCLGEALPEYLASPPPPRRRAAVGDLPQPLPPPCWIKVRETSPGCTCVERGGAVRSALDRIYRDLNRWEYDSVNRVLVTLPLCDLQRYEDALSPLVAGFS